MNTANLNYLIIVGVNKLLFEKISLFVFFISHPSFIKILSPLNKIASLNELIFKLERIQ